ncbi:MAG: septum formation family protein [Woeseiaceae bacterium]|nr:septum formation family protein [Woeseiaceae bacterium]
MKKLAAYVVAILGFGIYGAMTGVDRDDSGNIVGEGTLDAFQVRLGDCFDDPDVTADEFSSLPGVPCTEPHDNEAFAVFDLTMASYPENDIADISQSSCIDRFEAYVGSDYQSSSLDVVTMFPSPESWAQDDREVVCALYDMSGAKLVGSVKGRGI